MNSFNLNEYLNCVYSEWNTSKEPILAALGKKGKPRIELGNRIYGAKGVKSLSKDFRLFKISQLRKCNAILDLENKLSQMLAEFKNSLLLNKDYLFVFFDRPLEDVLGKLIDKNNVRY